MPFMSYNPNDPRNMIIECVHIVMKYGLKQKVVIEKLHAEISLLNILIYQKLHLFDIYLLVLMGFYLV